MIRRILTALAISAALVLSANGPAAWASHGNEAPVQGFDNYESRDTSVGQISHTWYVGSSSANPCSWEMFNNSGMGTLRIMSVYVKRRSDGSNYAILAGPIDLSPSEGFTWPIQPGSAINFNSEPYIIADIHDWDSVQGWHHQATVTLDLWNRPGDESDVYYALGSEPYCP